MTAPDPAPSPAQRAETKARLLRESAASAPLWIVTRGTSMGRAIPDGASVLVVPGATPRRGQVWVYCDESGDVVAHRYRRRTASGHVLRGDVRAYADAPIGDEQLVGRVTAVRCGDRVRAVGWRDRCVGECRRVPSALVARASRVTRRLRRAA